MPLVVARHGRTSWNAEGRFQGQGDPPLDSVGEAQAYELAAELAPLRPEWVASSDLVRALQTAECVAAACGLTVVTDPGFREVDLGGWEGLTRAQVAVRFPDEWARWSDGEDVRRGGGETRIEAATRFVATLDRYAGSRGSGSSGVVVAHGMVVQSALEVLFGRGALSSPDLSGGAPHLGNGQWLALDLLPVRG